MTLPHGRGSAAATPRDDRPAPAPSGRWRRRLRRCLGYGSLALLVLATVAWSLRRELLAPLVRPRLVALLTTALDAEHVSLGAIDGNWFTGLAIDDVHVVGRHARYAIDGARLELRYAPLALLRGDPRGLHEAHLTVAKAALDLRPGTATATAGTGPAAPFDVAAWQPLLQSLPAGASVTVAELLVVTQHGERRGALTLQLPATATTRELRGTYAGVDLRVQLPTATTVPMVLAARVEAEDPGGLLDLFALGAGVRHGTLHAELELRHAPWRIDAGIDLRDLVHGDHRLASSRITGHLDRDGLVIDSASLDLPGVRAELRAVALPHVFAGGAPAWHDVAGHLAVHLDDLSPHAHLLPVAWRTLLPLRGELRASVAAGRLQLDTCEVQARGVHLQVDRGTFLLTGDDWREAVGSLHGVLTCDDFAPTLPWLGATTIAGRIEGELAGSIAAPRATVDLALGACTSQRGAFAGGTGRVVLHDGALAVTDLRLQGLRVAALDSQAPTDLALTAGCRFGDAGLDPDSLAATLDLEGTLLGEWAAPWCQAKGLGPAPTGIASLHVQAQHGPAGFTIDALRLRTDPAATLAIGLDGAGTLPLHWPGRAAWQVLADGEVQLQVRVDRQATASAPPLAAAGTLHLGADVAALRGFVATFGAARWQGGLEAGAGLATLLSSTATAMAAPVRLDLELAALDLGTLPSGWSGPLQLQGSARGRVHAAGTAADFAATGDLTIEAGAVSAAGMQPLTDVDLRLVATANAGTAPAVQLTIAGSANLAPAFAPERVVTFTAGLQCDALGTRLTPATLRVGGGEATVALDAELRSAELLALLTAPSTFGGRRLTGQLVLRAFELEHLPEAWHGLGPLQGTLQGEAALAGTFAEAAEPGFVHSATLSLHDGGVKLGSLPRLDHVAAELAYDENALTLRSLTGRLGAGRFTGQGSLASTTPLAASFGNATLALQVRGEDVLLHRADGAQVRASLQLAANGSLQAVVVTGDVQLGRGSKYVRRLSVLPDLGARGGAAAHEGIDLFTLPPALGDHVSFDVGLQTREPFEVRSEVLDGEVDVGLRLRGTGTTPSLEGTLSLRRGTLRFPGAALQVDSGLLTFTPGDPRFPVLLVKAEGKRMGITVTLTITGRYDRAQVQLSSVPPLPPQDLIVLLTTGQLPSTLADRGTEGQARFVGGYLAKEIFDRTFGNSTLESGGTAFDRLSIEAGREVSRNGIESVRIEYELLPTLAVQVERDAYEDYNLGVVLRFRFR